MPPKWSGVWTDATALVAGRHDFQALDLLPGSYLERTYKAATFRVYIVPQLTVSPAWAERGWGRYVYLNDRYKTLSTIAAVITGDPTRSGHRFFGLRRRRRGART